MGCSDPRQHRQSHRWRNTNLHKQSQSGHPHWWLRAGLALSKAKCLFSAKSPGVIGEELMPLLWISRNTFGGLVMGHKAGICALVLLMARHEK